MPKGHKQIDWTAENDARLMLTILAVENVHPNCEAVAAAFGESFTFKHTNHNHSLTSHNPTGAGLNAQAISNRLSRLRKKAADEGFLPKASGVETSRKTQKGEVAKKRTVVPE